MKKKYIFAHGLSGWGSYDKAYDLFLDPAFYVDVGIEDIEAVIKKA